jgi:hypothetical protein
MLTTSDEEWYLFKRNRSEAPQRERDELVSHILLRKGDLRERRVVPGREKMKVGEEERRVVEGDVIYIPPDNPHSIENLSERSPHLRLGGYPHRRKS